MSLSVLICDDLAEDRAALSRMTERYGWARELDVRIETASGGKAMQTMWKPRRWDVAFLDIYMPGISGIECARWLRERDRACAVIFSTTSADHGPTGYELGVSDYLVKPYAQEDLDSALDWIIHSREKDLRTLRVHVNWEVEEIRLRDIQYIETQGKISVIHRAEGDISIRRGMDDLASELAEDSRFFRCHRSFLVNLDLVDRIKGRDFILDDGRIVPISAANLTAAKWALVEHDTAAAWEM